MSTISFQQRPFGTLTNGQTVMCYSLRNTSGMIVNLLNYGATLNTIQIPDSRGNMHEITLGFTQLEAYTKSCSHSGATLAHLPSRYGISLNKLHQTIWEADITTQPEAASVELKLKGTLHLRYPFAKTEYLFITRYTLTGSDELIIHTQIQTSSPLPIFMTHHPVWNLGGVNEGDITDHVLQVWAQHYSMIDSSGFPEKNRMEIEEKSPFNFKQPQRIGEKRAQLESEKKYDICFELDKPSENSTVARRLAARVKAPISGRTLEVYTTADGLRFYLAKASESGALKGLCLSPLPLINTTTNSAYTNFMQETCYKLIW